MVETWFINFGERNWADKVMLFIAVEYSCRLEIYLLDRKVGVGFAYLSTGSAVPGLSNMVNQPTLVQE